MPKAKGKVMFGKGEDRVGLTENRRRRHITFPLIKFFTKSHTHKYVVRFLVEFRHLLPISRK